MQFFVLTRRSGDFTEADFRTGLPGEVRRIRELYGAAVIRQIWRRADSPGAVLLIETADEQEARDALSTLPLVAAGMVLTDALIPLEPYAGFVNA